MKQTILISSITVTDRQRSNLGDVSRLADSIRRIGLINPIRVTPDNGSFRLIAGERRLTACKALGLTEVDVLISNNLTEAELQEIEYDENVHRKDLCWQERCIAIAKLHDLRSRNAVLSDTRWTQAETAELLNCAVGTINFTLHIAKRLADKTSPFWQMDQMVDAIRYIHNEAKDAALREIALRQTQITAAEAFDLPTTRPTTVAQPLTTNDKAAALERYLSNPHNPPEEFEAYWTERLSIAIKPEPINLSSRLHNTCALHFLAEHPATFHHIITDPPYGIDMAMLSQENVGMTNIDAVSAEHDVEENETLLAKFFPLAFSALRNTGFLVLWCDAMQWHFLFSTATAAGFRVQRWPIVWAKDHTCQNSAAQYNYTKRTEFAMICRKPNATLVSPATTNIIHAAHDELKSTSDHPFVKPFAVWEFIYKHICIPGETVLDPFAGHGSAVISAFRMSLNPIACEINPSHFNALRTQLISHFTSLNPNATFC